MWNPVNDWIRKAKTPESKDARRYTVAWLALGAGLLAAPFTYGISALVGVVVFLIKVRNAWKDRT